MKMPINLQRWIEENRDALKPPVGNKKIYEDGDFIIFIVGGPNTRKDYHINTTQELFYQLEGAITVKVIEDGIFKDIVLQPGELFLLPANTPHSPRRGPDTAGLVVEVQRPAGSPDTLRWYCESCGHLLKEVTFPLEDIVGQLKAALEAFMQDEEARTCDNCGTVMQF